MKYIISEDQNNRYKILRRIDSTDWNLIIDIVNEGLDLHEPCDFKKEDNYLYKVCRDSARTYLFNYMELNKYYDYAEGRFNDEFQILLKFVIELIENRLGNKIREHYIEEKEDC
jgi:hypothetical protein